MKCSPLLLASLAMAFASCATSKSAQPKAAIPSPGIGIEQVVGPREVGYPYGPIEVKYNFAVQNNATIPITLIRVDIQSDNPAGGAYSLRRNFYNFKQEIPPNSIGVVTFWAKAFGWGRGMRETEPVTVRGVAYFQSPNGNLQKVFIRELSQYPD
jgi:hypothetical protein